MCGIVRGKATLTFLNSKLPSTFLGLTPSSDKELIKDFFSITEVIFPAAPMPEEIALIEGEA